MTMELATPSSARVIDGALLDRLDGLQAHLEANIIGQPEVIPEVVKTIKNAELGFTEAGEPRSAFLFLGPTGVGKTEVTLQFTEYVCGPGKLIRLDMSEFMNLDAVGLLIGTPSDNPEVRRGLLGQYYDRTGGTGTLLFDEIEKAHRQVQDLFLQILDASRISLGNGETLNLSHMFLVATSNIGSQMLMHSRTRNRETIVRRVQTEAKGQMRPEIYARFHPVVVFNRLDFDAQRDIARVHLNKVLRHMAGLGHRLDVDDSVLGPIIDRGYSEELGARPMRNAARAAVREAVREAVFARDTGHGTIRYDRSGQRFFLDSSSSPVASPSTGQNRPAASTTEPLNV